MVMVDLIVALGVPLWLGGEELLRARGEAEPVTDESDALAEGTQAPEPTALGKA